MMKFIKLLSAISFILSVFPGTTSAPLPSDDDVRETGEDHHKLFKRKGGGRGGSGYSGSSGVLGSGSSDYDSSVSSYVSPTTESGSDWWDIGSWSSPYSLWGWYSSSSSSTPRSSKPKSTGMTPSAEIFHRLFRRKGGGRGGFGGGFGGGGGGGRSPARGGFSRPRSRGPKNSNSNRGGSTTVGSGTPRLSSGRYQGGSRVPYTSGHTSPSGILPFFMGYGAAWMPLMLMSYPHGYHMYHLNNTLPAVRNASETQNSTAKYPVLCFCQNYGVCSCDDININITLAGNSTENMKWNTTYALINGTEYSLLNGTLANGTTAPGGNRNNATSLHIGGWVIWVASITIGVFFVN